ncbi:transcriptional regulator [Aliidiomarina iranensis]|uniref:Transcriptional regulator n=1 Tax=Aliidiomarina iranensis TaxID=1434071 RepID=A0A432VT79_9GAMM|nr:transcriptional regulator [Aliidiomarina iranensis]RUO19638.1 transcriptional regulator [Aliidiomarina iranensis]
MKARIGVMSEELIRKRMIDVASGKIINTENAPKFWFTSLNAVAQLLCKENTELLILMHREKPNNLTELALMSGRSLSNLSHTIKSLSSKGFVSIERNGRSSRPIALFTDFEIVMGDSLDREAMGDSVAA